MRLTSNSELKPDFVLFETGLYFEMGLWQDRET